MNMVEVSLYERKTYYRDEDIHIYLENINDDVFIHVAINNMTKPVLKKIKSIWGEVVIKMYTLGYERLFAYTRDNRIIKLIGGAEQIGAHEDYEVYRWELN